MQLRQVFHSSITARIVAVMVFLALAQLAVAQVVADGGATGHAWVHVLLFVLPSLALAALIVLRWPNAGHAARLPVIGLSTLAAAPLIESVGALGFGVDNESRVNGIVILHDLGLGLTGIGLLAALVGMATGVGIASWRLDGRRRWLGLAAMVVVGSGGLLFVLAMTGMLPFGG